MILTVFVMNLAIKNGEKIFLIFSKNRIIFAKKCIYIGEAAVKGRQKRRY